MKQKKLKEGRRLMKKKGMGKWLGIVLLGVLLAGCIGGGSTSGSSEENPIVPSKETPVRGTWKVSVSGGKVDIEPVSLGASACPVTRVTDQQVTLQGNDTVSLGHTRVIGVKVYSAPGMQGTKYSITTDYEVYFHQGLIARRVGSSIPDGGTVYVTYDYYPSASCEDYLVYSTNISHDPGTQTTTADIVVENAGQYATYEEIRSMTGNLAGPGAADDPHIWINNPGSHRNGVYPLVQGDTPTTSPQSLASDWVTGTCFTTAGNWRWYFSPAVHGCRTWTHPSDNNPWMHQALDPVCGRLSTTHEFSGTNQNYVFYMQLTGDRYPWVPDFTDTTSPRDSRWQPQWFTTWYASMAYLVPTNDQLNGKTTGGSCVYDDPGIRAYLPGFLGKATLGDNPPDGITGRCGTLITDPHLAPGTYFALNVGLEYPDWLESKQKTFWDTYRPVSEGGSDTPKTVLTVGAPYVFYYGFQILYDPNILETFPDGDYSTLNGTYFPGGFVDQFTATANNNQTAMPRVTGILGSKFLRTTGLGNGYFFTLQRIAAGTPGGFIFFKAPTTSPYRTYLYVTQNNSEWCGGTGANAITNQPRFAGQWGAVHYERNGNPPACKEVTEGPDAEVDFWFGMRYFKVSGNASSGDWSYIRFDQTDNNMLYQYWNNKSADNLNAANNAVEDLYSSNFCWRNTNNSEDVDPCPAGYDNLNLVIWKNVEVGNPYLPPGVRNVPPAWSTQGGIFPQCPKRQDGSYTCGGRQMVVGVVCVQ